MKSPLEGIHLDPSQDVPEPYLSTLALLCDLSEQVGRFRSGCRGNEFVLALLTHLEGHLVAMGVVLVTKIEMDAS